MEKLQINPQSRAVAGSSSTGAWHSEAVAESALNAAATFWFVITALGQWMFVIYVVGFYGPILFQNGLEGLADTHLPNGFIHGDTAGNVAIAAHLLLAGIIIGGGPLQLIPWVRERFPVFHHWNGRVYLLTAVTTSIAGLYMIWTRGTIGGTILQYGITLDGILILVFSGLTVRYAIARKIVIHRRWALRLFMVASGVWFYRIGFMGWTVLSGGIGIDFETFSGPFLYFWAFGQYLIPLAVLELYLFTRQKAGARGRIAMSALLFAVTILMGFGIFAAAMGMWLPRL